jgi:hypothetical protein
VVDPVRALVATTGAFTLTLVPALVFIPALTDTSPSVTSPVLTTIFAPALYVLFGRAQAS